MSEQKCAIHDACFKNIEKKIDSLQADIKEDLRANKQTLARFFDKLDEWIHDTAIQQAKLEELANKIHILENKIEQHNNRLLFLDRKITWVSATISFIATIGMMLLKKFVNF